MGQVAHEGVSLSPTKATTKYTSDFSQAASSQADGSVPRHAGVEDRGGSPFAGSIVKSP